MKVTELLFKVYPYLPGTFLIGVYHGADELAATVVMQRDWMDEKIQKEIMDKIGLPLIKTYVLPDREGEFSGMRTEVVKVDESDTETAKEAGNNGRL
jgi:hypothetical protein